MLRLQPLRSLELADEPARPRRDNRGRPKPRLGDDDGWGCGAAGAWSSAQRVSLSVSFPPLTNAAEQDEEVAAPATTEAAAAPATAKARKQTPDQVAAAQLKEQARAACTSHHPAPQVDFASSAPRRPSGFVGARDARVRGHQEGQLSNRVGGGATASGLDKYENRSAKDEAVTPFQWLRRGGKVPLISGAHLFYSEPLTAEYTESMLKLHTTWRKVSQVPKGEAAIT